MSSSVEITNFTNNPHFRRDIQIVENVGRTKYHNFCEELAFNPEMMQCKDIHKKFDTLPKKFLFLQLHRRTSIPNLYQEVILPYYSTRNPFHTRKLNRNK